MFRNLFRRGIPVLVLLLALAGAVPVAAQSAGLDLWDGVWRWVASFWWEGERGLELDPNGSTTTTEGGGEGEGDRGLGLDPNG